MVTRRATQRQYLLRPDSVMTALFNYLIVQTAGTFGIVLITWVAMSNHYHAILWDRFGLFPRFLASFHRLLAVSVNALRGREENMFSNAETNVVVLDTLESVLEKIVYIHTNPVAAHLVDRVTDWPGASTFDYLSGKVVTLFRPPSFGNTSKLPKTVDLVVGVPPLFSGTQVEFGKVCYRLIADKDAAIREKRILERKPIVGRKRVMSESPFASPSTPREPRRFRPVYAGRDQAARKAAASVRAWFLDSYKKALELFRSGERATVFPFGTWKMRLLGACCYETEPLRPSPS